MICFPINMSTPWTRFSYVSNKQHFIDTYSEHVHAMDRKDQIQFDEMFDNVIIDEPTTFDALVKSHAAILSS
jgi:hypothetical protein